MRKNNGFILLGIVVLISILVLTAMAVVLEQDTKLKRFKEDELKLNLSALRRGIDIYRYKYTVVEPDPVRIAALDAALQSGNVETVTGIIAAESFVRARVSGENMEWRVIENLLKNPSFEIDDGTDFGYIGSWRGNSTASDMIPDGWQVMAGGVEQLLRLEANTFVISLWARCQSVNSKLQVQIWGPNSLPLCDFFVDSTDWKRYFASFSINASGVVRVLVKNAGSASGEISYIDGIMLEVWNPPAGVPADTPPVPSAWARDRIVVPAQAQTVLQQRQFADVIPVDATPASLSWWFQW